MEHMSTTGASTEQNMNISTGTKSIITKKTGKIVVTVKKKNKNKKMNCSMAKQNKKKNPKKL